MTNGLTMRETSDIGGLRERGGQKEESRCRVTVRGDRGKEKEEGPGRERANGGLQGEEKEVNLVCEEESVPCSFDSLEDSQPENDEEPGG